MLDQWRERFELFFEGREFSDGSHDIRHFRRVWSVAEKICNSDDDKLAILAACYFHDIVSYPKNHPDRSKSSAHAALRAEEILKGMGFPVSKLETVKHAILTHSFSANISPETNEAKVVQDADRMEAIGAIGLARVFYVSGMMGGKLFDSMDPFAENRELDDKKFAVDHFYTKLLKLPEMLQTEKGKSFAVKRTKVLLKFLEDLKQEL